MEVIRCPNPKCRRRILDDEGTETEWTVLEIKCQHCGKLVRLHFGPEGIEAGIYERKNGGDDPAVLLHCGKHYI